MKKTIILALLFAVSSSCFSQKIELNAKVDERCELLSLVFRLADAHEYVTHLIPVYVDGLEKYFEPYKNHEIIDYTKSIREKFKVGYDAPMNLAIHLQIVDNKISLIPNVKTSSLEDRWDIESLPHYIELLNDFYTTTKFHDFFESHSAFIEKAELTATEYFQNVDMEWYAKFFGEVPKGNFNLIISLSNGGNNYGPKVEYLDGGEDIYAIIGCGIDSLNNPFFNDAWALELVVHEFCHSFCNNLIDEYYDQMKMKADEFYEIKQDLLRKQAYSSSKIMLYEILVRASVIKYMADHYSIPLQRSFSNEKTRGFIWIEELYNALLDYEQHRDKYPTLRSYMPEIVKLQDQLNPQKMVEEQEKLIPLMSISNIENGQQDVEAETTTQIIVKFNKKMNTQPCGATPGQKGKDFYPEIIDAKWNKETKTEWILEVKLEPNKEYSIVFPAQWFYSEEGVNPKNTVYLDFKTK